MGEDVFRSLSAHYIREHLPSSPLLQLYGKTFPSYVEKSAEHLAQHYLADLARLEYAPRLSYHSADAPPYDWQNLAHLKEDRLSSVIVDSRQLSACSQATGTSLSFGRMHRNSWHKSAKSEITILLSDLSLILTLLPSQAHPQYLFKS